MSALTCTDGKVYATVRKYREGNTKVNMYQILDGTTVLEHSEARVENYVLVTEHCLPATLNNQYSFKIINRRNNGDGWFRGDWITVAGIYGNIMLKTTLANGIEELYALSLYYPVMKNEEWKMIVAASTMDSNWYTVAFDESSWTAATLGSVTTTATGSQYFRKHFAGIPNMAAYEVELNYRYGIVMYINGVEVFRDHMADGAVTPTTASTDAYEAYEYHGVIRPAGEIEGSNNVLAVELHFPDPNMQNAVEFNAYVASIAPSTPITENTHCFVYPYDVSTSANARVLWPEAVFNWDMDDSLSADYFGFPVDVKYNLTGPLAHINAVRLWPATEVDFAPTIFTLSGAMSSSGPFSDVVSVSSASFNAFAFKTFFGSLNAKPYQTYRLLIQLNAKRQVILHEMQLVTCHDLVPTLAFVPSSYSVILDHEPVSIHPQSQEFSSCTVTPSLPAGLTLNAATCTISGTPTAALAQTTFTMTSEMEGQSYEGTFTLEVTACSGTVVTVARSYRHDSVFEAFSIKDVTTQQVVMNVEVNSGQRYLETVSTMLCLTGTRYEVSVSSTKSFWYASSMLYLRAMYSKDEYETIARVHYDALQSLPEVYTVNTQWLVAPHAQWFYKMNEVPANWYGSETSGWSTSSMGAFPASSNQIQLYKQTFSVSSLENVAGFVISLRYQYGCVIYLNGVEVFRNGVTGDLTADSTSSNAYTKVMYRQISLPARTTASSDASAVNYLVEGANTIAIAIVAQSASQTESVFDCTVRLMDALESRLFDLDVTSNGISGKTELIVMQYYSWTVSSSDCANENDYTIAFKNDRREWISSVALYLHYQQENQQPRQFVLKARNADEEWTTLKTVTGLSWTRKGEHKKIWLANDKPWNQYRFESIGTGDASNCAWKFSTLDLLADAIPAVIPDLSYPESLSFVKDMEITAVYPNGDQYYDFTISPTLPAGVVMDSATGVISGEPSEATGEVVYTISAKKYGGVATSTQVTIVAELCFGVKSMITFTARLDEKPQEASYKLFAGKGTDGDPLYSITKFTLGNALNYAKWCLPHNFYTLVLYDSNRDGWDYKSQGNGGWYLTVGSGLIFEMGMMNYYMSSASTVFSSVVPFQFECGEWKVWNKEEAVSTDWRSVSFDDSTWTSVKATELGNHMGTTAYVRHEVTVPSLEDYHVLNVHLKYAGGVVAYFNGVKVARFNLGEDFDATTEAMAVHDATAFSKFHVILPTAGAVEGTNVIAFEIHRASSQPALVFDATGVFGVNDCSPVVDSFSAIDASDLLSGTKEGMLDYDTTTNGRYYYSDDSFLSWTVENLEGSSFNSFGFHTSQSPSYHSFSVLGRWNSEEYTGIVSPTRESINSIRRNAWSAPIGFARFNQFKVLQQDLIINTYVTQYCVPSGTGMCAADGDYPAVKNGEWSVVKGCPEYRYGYTYRVCTNGMLGDAQYDKCKYYAPTDLAYSESSYTVLKGVAFSSDVPSYDNFISSFEVVNGTLPAGLELNTATGEIHGTASIDGDTGEYALTIEGANADASTTVTLSLSVIAPTFSYPVVGAGVHVVAGEVSVSPVMSPDYASPFTFFEATGLPAGLSVDASGVISGSVSGKQTAQVSVDGYINGVKCHTVSFTLFVHDHSAAQPFVPEDASCSFTLRMFARGAIASGAVYLDSAHNANTLGLTELTLEAGAMKSVFVCLTDAEYIIHAANLNVVVLKNGNPLAFITNTGGSFSTTPVCEESLDVECDIVTGEGVIVKESDAVSGTAYSTGDIVVLDRSKTYEM